MKSIGFGAYDGFASVKLPGVVPHYPILRKAINPTFGDLGAFEKITGWEKIKNIIGLMITLGMTVGAKIYLKRFSLLKRVDEKDMPLVGRMLYKADKYILPMGLANMSPFVITLAVGRHIPFISYITMVSSGYFLYKMWPELYETLTTDTTSVPTHRSSNLSSGIWA